MPSLNHTHSYIRLPKSREIFKCNDSHCSHTQQRKYLNNVASLCPRCGTEFKLTWSKLQRAAPVCDENCAQTKEAKQKRHIKEVMEKLTSLTDRERQEQEFVLEDTNK